MTIHKRTCSPRAHIYCFREAVAESAAVLALESYLSGWRNVDGRDICPACAPSPVTWDDENTDRLAAAADRCLHCDIPASRGEHERCAQIRARIDASIAEHKALFGPLLYGPEGGAW